MEPPGSPRRRFTRLFSAQLAALHHGGILLLETLIQTLRALEVLVNAAHQALLFPVGQGLGGEIVHAVIKAPLNHLGIHLQFDRDKSVCCGFGGGPKLESKTVRGE